MDFRKIYGFFNRYLAFEEILFEKSNNKKLNAIQEDIRLNLLKVDGLTFLAGICLFGIYLNSQEDHFQSLFGGG